MDKKKQVRLDKLLDKLWHHMCELNIQLAESADQMEEDTVDDVYSIGLAQKEVRTLLRSLSNYMDKEMPSAQSLRRHRVRADHSAPEGLVYSMQGSGYRSGIEISRDLAQRAPLRILGEF